MVVYAENVLFEDIPSEKYCKPMQISQDFNENIYLR